MKIFTNKKIFKRIAIFLIIIMACSFVVPKYTVNAESFKEDDEGNAGRKNVGTNNEIINVHR